MEPRYKTLVVALVPQPRQMPPPPFDAEDLQWIFSDVTRHYNYQSFEFLPTRRGAIFANEPEDAVELRPALLQVQAKMDSADLLTAEMARDKAVKILKIASERLKIETFLQCAIQIVASVDAPEPARDAKTFVAEQLMRDSDQASVLGSEFFGGGVRFRKLEQSEMLGEDSLSIEPFIHDNALIYLNYERTRAGAAGPIGELEQVSSWVEEGFDFVSGQAMSLLTR